MVTDAGQGASVSRLIALATTNATVVKASAGRVLQVSVNNTNAAARYLKLYNKATAPTVGTDVPVLTIPLAATSANHISYPGGVKFATGIGFALTTGIADADTAAVSANEHVVNVIYD
jgi:hypothetical protein